MGLLGKVFRRSKKSLGTNSSDSNSNSQRRKLSWKERRALKKLNQSGSFNVQQPQDRSGSRNQTNMSETNGSRRPVNLVANSHQPEEYVRKPAFSTQMPTPTESRNPYSYNDERGNRRRPSPRDRMEFDSNNNASNAYRSPHNSQTTHQNKNTSPSMYDRQNEAKSTPSPTSNLKFEQVQRFEQQQKQQQQQNYHHPYETNNSNKKLQLTRLQNGQLAAMDRFTSSSPLSASSEFDLSTDAEDNDYNRIRHYNVKPMLNPRSPDSEDGDENIMLNRSKNYFSDSDHDTLNSPAQDTLGSNNSNSNKNHYAYGGTSKFTFDKNKTSKTRPRNDDEMTMDSTMTPRTLAIKTAQNLKTQDVFPPRTTRSQESDLSKSSLSQNDNNSSNGKRNEHSNTKGGIIENFADFETFGKNEFTERSAKSMVDATSPVAQLLAQAQARRMNRKSASQSVNSEPGLNATLRKEKQKSEKEKFLQLLKEGQGSDSDNDDSDKEKDVNESWLMDEVTGALGPRGISADLESLGERSSGHRSHRSHRSSKSYKSQKSPKSTTSQRHKKRSDESVGSRHSRSSRYSLKSTKSYLSQMSHESRSVAQDLIRLEMQLAMVNKNGENDVKKQLQKDAQRKGLKDGISVGDHSRGATSFTSRKSSRKNMIPKRLKTNVTAPPGKLGIILANRTDSKGTVVSGVRTTSVLANRISPGDRIVAIDGEDVSRMSVPEITAIMARKSDFERVLTVLITSQK